MVIHSDNYVLSIDGTAVRPFFYITLTCSNVEGMPIDRLLPSDFPQAI